MSKFSTRSANEKSKDMLKYNTNTTCNSSNHLPEIIKENMGKESKKNKSAKKSPSKFKYKYEVKSKSIFLISYLSSTNSVV